MFLRLACFGKSTGISFVDSTCIPVMHNRREFSMKVFKGIAAKGRSTMRWYVGFKLHLLCNEKGELVNFVLTRANVDDREESVMDTLTDRVSGKLYADRGYISQSLFGLLWDNGVHLVTGLRSNMKQRLMPLYDKIMLRKRSVIESVNDILKRHTQECGATGAFPPSQRPQFHHEPARGNGGILLLLHKAGSQFRLRGA